MNLTITRILNKIFDMKPVMLVLGDIMLDRFIYGRADRISPEAPVPIVKCFKELDILGGCGNVIRNLSNLKVKTNLVSAIGEDAIGEIIKSKLTEIGISLSGLLSTPSINSTHKIRIVAEKQQVVRVDWDADLLTGEEYQVLEEYLSCKLHNVDCIIISDYNKGLCSSVLIQSALKGANKQKIPVFVDPKGKNWSKYEGATLITPNTKEAEGIVGYKLVTKKNFEEASKKICKDYNIKSCLITKGKDGMSYFGKDQIDHISTSEREVYDVSGAGDTVIACLAAAIVSGLSIKEAIYFANEAAGIVVSHLGTAAITIDELKRL